ncbi:primary-amine oxidase [Anabaena sp. FACHB-1237]|uniref:primary-amine oxidase n=1 Tax=Anabaena sp. FACHB-1237 TaxID=2692769 RepID=UPI001680B531|nr:primary-amine oxidase [Anabaena sp. FACHB-1237]MBD2139403.1 primary-amine oxidase [Anabaena sp. FACHB-1237]
MNDNLHSLLSLFHSLFNPFNILSKWRNFILIPLVIFLNICLVFPEITLAQETQKNQKIIIQHPLDSLTETEINTAVAILKQQKNISKNAFFSMIALQEPDKDEVVNFISGKPFTRQVFLETYQSELNKTSTAIVDINKKAVIFWEEKTDIQPAILPPDYQIVQQIVKSDHRWQNAMKKRGIRDFHQVKISCWAAGILTLEEENNGKRICRALSYYQGEYSHQFSNYFAHPVEGVVLTVDLNNNKVENFVDNVIDNEIITVASENWDYEQSSFQKITTLKKPKLKKTFTIRGNEITWKNWQFRYLMHPREGLVLYLVKYQDGQKYRPILYRGSLSEIVVPYGDPDPNWSFRNALDVGEYNIGLLANKLELGGEIPENGVLLDAIFANGEGETYTKSQVIGVYERDNGILWKHFSDQRQKNSVYPNRELVISMITTVDNYDYALNWIFHEDGTIEIENQLTGIDLPQGTNLEMQTENNSYGRLIAKNIFGVNHQHFFNYRLDLDIDGQNNKIMEMNVNSLPISEKNPLGNAITVADTLLTTEKIAVRDVDIKHSREWMIASADKKNYLGVSPAYMLMPGGNTIMYAVPGAKIREKAQFATHHFWATKYKNGEMYAAGNYPNQGKKGQGLPQYISDNESLENEDVVIWYTMGITHVPRPEDWPVMPRHQLSFKLFPRGFFQGNPTIK